MKNNFIYRIASKNEYYKDLDTLLNHNVIKYFMKDCNAMISGGLAEKIFKKVDLGNYLCSDDYNGDIDLYFRNNNDHQKAMNYAKKMAGEPRHLLYGEREIYVPQPDIEIVNAEWSCTKISFEGHIQFQKDWGQWRAKFQLVGGKFFGKPSKFLASYDFANLQRCYFYKDDLLAVCESKRCIELSDSKLLDIRHSQSPMMMHRLNKYLKYRGYVGITPGSKEHITDWLIRARAGMFKEKIDGIQLFSDAVSSPPVEMLVRSGVVETKDLVLLIGKIIRYHTERRGYKYHDTVTEDVALEALKARSKIDNEL